MNTAVTSLSSLRQITPGLTGSKSNAPRPFLKWAGGKSQLLPAFAQYFPKSFNRYFEPFVGSGAVFFRLQPEVSFLSDLNSELINCYEVVRDDVDKLINALRRHVYEEEHYYHVRAMDTKKLTQHARAARLIYLNKTCFNGLYRVNSRGQFNVPFGRYSNPLICDTENLRRVNRALRKVTLSTGNFEQTLKQARKGDFVYLDPPYQPISATSNFTGYTKDSFSYEHQEKLAKTVKALSKRGCLIMLSNSDCNEIRSLYKDFRIEVVTATRAINCKSDRRKAINELVILNY